MTEISADQCAMNCALCLRAVCGTTPYSLVVTHCFIDSWFFEVCIFSRIRWAKFSLAQVRCMVVGFCKLVVGLQGLDPECCLLKNRTSRIQLCVCISSEREGMVQLREVLEAM